MGSEQKLCATEGCNFRSTRTTKYCEHCKYKLCRQMHSEGFGTGHTNKRYANENFKVRRQGEA